MGGQVLFLILLFNNNTKVDTISFKTVSLNKATVDKQWVVVDATDAVLGRMATKVAKLLRGKYKPAFTPHVDCGDNVILINADKIQLTGKKWDDRVMFSHSGYPGGQRELSPRDVFEKSPEKLIRHTIKGMMPKNRLSREVLRNLYIYEGSEHPHEA